MYLSIYLSICLSVYLSIYLFNLYIYTIFGPGSSVGIETDYGLDGPGSNPGENEIFRPSRPALGLTQPPVKCTGSFPGVKFSRGVLLTTHPLLVELYLYPPSGPHRACNGITLPLPIQFT